MGKTDIISEIYTLSSVEITKNITDIPEWPVRPKNRGIFLDYSLHFLNYHSGSIRVVIRTHRR